MRKTQTKYNDGTYIRLPKFYLAGVRRLRLRRRAFLVIGLVAAGGGIGVEGPCGREDAVGQDLARDREKADRRHSGGPP